GIGFAIPSSLARPVIEQLKAKGKVSRGWLGVQIQELTPAIAKSLGLPSDRGALVSDVMKGGPAENAGLKPGDVIQSFNGHDIDRVRDLPIIVAEAPARSSAKVGVWRKGSKLTFDVRIAEQPANMEVSATSPSPGPASAVGVELTALTKSLRRRFDIPNNVHGVVVRSVSDSSPLAQANIEVGDVIVSINQEPVTTPEAAVTMIDSAVSGPNKSILLQINRRGINEYVAWSEQTGNG
ncbi:MAG TPA: PDZ domain-containing protein, partial [Stellaceae bacterium]|nr:PDZ domain-containing protein [Stellaceae bacterium]